MPEIASIMVIVMLASSYVYRMPQYCAVAKCHGSGLHFHQFQLHGQPYQLAVVVPQSVQINDKKTSDLSGIKEKGLGLDQIC